MVQDDQESAWRCAINEGRELSDDSRHDLHTGPSREISRSDRNELAAARKSDAGLRFKTKSGIRVRSKIERIIADFLFEEGIRFIYEPQIWLDGLGIRPDFYLTDYDLFYEHFGVSADA